MFNNQKITQKSCSNIKDCNKKRVKEIKSSIKKYIDKNTYLFKTDTLHTVQSHLKPRIVSQSVENACLVCTKNICPMKKCKSYKFNKKEILKSNFTKGMNFATKYINTKD